MMTIIVRNVSILDGTGAPPFPGTVLVEDGRITGVTRGSAQISAEGAEVIEGGGATLTPGLIESHLHLDLGSTSDRINPMASR